LRKRGMKITENSSQRTFLIGALAILILSSRVPSSPIAVAVFLTGRLLLVIDKAFFAY
jgi:hypothetical protein